jgi:DNA-binding SARP family transcriptional activator
MAVGGLSGQRNPVETRARPGALRLTLMRGFELTCDGLRISLPRSAQRLIAFLALNQRPMLRRYVACMLWLDSSEAQSTASLRTALWRLRRPGHHLIDLDGDCLSIAGDLAVDVHRLEIAARRVGHSDAILEAAELNELTAGGELLPGWYEDWVLLERERTRQLWLQTLEAACEGLTLAGRHAEAVVTALAAVEAEPLRESAHRALIKAHLGGGNRAEALRQFGLYAEALKRELQLEPSDEMQELTNKLRRSV